MTLSDREFSTMMRDRWVAPAQERADMMAQLAGHVYDESSMRSYAELLPQGASEATDAIMRLQGVTKAIEMENRVRREEKGLTRQALFDDPLYRWTEVPGTLPRLARVPPQMLRRMANDDPIIVSILQIMRNRALRFCKETRGGIQAMMEGAEGFDIVPTFKESWEALTPAEEQERASIVNFILNSGDVGRFTFGARPNREDLRREPMAGMMSHRVHQRYVLDAVAVELEKTRNKRRLSGLYVVDGATIARTDAREWPYGEIPEAIHNPTAAYVQIVRNQPFTTFGSEDLWYEYANPRDAIGLRGYGFSETEMSIKLTTGILNVLTTNNAIFDRGAVPPGILAILGQINQQQMLEFQQEWDRYRLGAGGQWGLPAINIRDPQGKLAYLRTDGNPSEMVFSAYINFLAAIRCATFGVDVQEVNVSAFGGSNSGLNSGKDTQTRIDESKNRAFFPFMDGALVMYNELLKAFWGGRWRMTFVGLIKEDAKSLRETFQRVATVDEVRMVMLKMPPIGGVVGTSLANNPAVSQMTLSALQHGMIVQNEDGGFAVNAKPQGEAPKSGGLNKAKSEPKGSSQD